MTPRPQQRNGVLTRSDVLSTPERSGRFRFFIDPDQRVACIEADQPFLRIGQACAAREVEDVIAFSVAKQGFPRGSLLQRLAVDERNQPRSKQPHRVESRCGDRRSRWIIVHFAPAAFFLERAESSMNFTPSSSPLMRISPQRRETRPDADNTRKNSLRFNPLRDSSVDRRAPVAEMSNSVQ